MRSGLQFVRRRVATHSVQTWAATRRRQQQEQVSVGVDGVESGERRRRPCPRATEVFGLTSSRRRLMVSHSTAAVSFVGSVCGRDVCLRIVVTTVAAAQRLEQFVIRIVLIGGKDAK
jgi:hypothetical protein